MDIPAIREIAQVLFFYVFVCFLFCFLRIKVHTNCKKKKNKKKTYKTSLPYHILTPPLGDSRRGLSKASVALLGHIE